MRDSQRKKLYTAERSVFGGNASTARVGVPLPTVEDVEKYVDKVMSRKVVKRYFRTDPVKVADGRGTRWAFARGSSKINIPRWARTEWVVLHELAHILDTRDQRKVGDRRAAHGWQFAGTYLFLVRTMLGKDAAADLKASFRKHRVKFTKPRAKRKFNDEQLRVLRERMSVARAAFRKGELK